MCDLVRAHLLAECVPLLPVLPRARIDGLTSTINGTELLIHDAERNHFHTLNATASAVWRACDGTRSVEEIAARTGFDAAVVTLTLDKLSDAHLLAATVPSSGMSRRDVARRLAAAGVAGAVALPVIASITSESALAAGTACTSNDECGNGNVCLVISGGFCGPCIPRGGSCVTDGDCCSGDICYQFHDGPLCEIP